ncbi:mis18-binding protein 1 isoform X4 [Micropterus salmoides]|uniref:mis18-binding protein 1 isoform X4 n=1 Tax=Micropterus salmoides TaxID=27706 RepID=UPI0018EC038E|nr:mis18-binding protein 1 isoform X4 [Micropterus salmoides]
MASYHHVLQHTRPRFESPAKVFAKLKSKVQREGMCAKDGTLTGKAPLCNVREKHGAGFRSPRKRAESTWMTDDLKENQRFGSYRNEAQALTLSPISSPQKTGCSYSDLSSRLVEEMPPVTDIGHGCTQRQRAFLESTVDSRPFRKQILTEPPQIRDLNGFKVTSRTPVKIQPVENDYVRSVFEEECAPLEELTSPTYIFSPMRKRLRKRKWELHELNKVSSSTKEISNEIISQPRERKTSSASSKDDTQKNTPMDLGGSSADRSEMNQFTQEAMFPPPRPTATKRCYVTMEKILPMSPAKMFAYMKERESKVEQLEVQKVCSSTRDLFDGGNFHQSRDSPPSTAHSMREMEDSAFASAPESVAPVTRPTEESADSQSDTDPSEDALIPAEPSQAVLLEDPLVLNTPRISIPKKQEAVFKRNKWPNCAKFPSESVIYLKKWFLRKNHKGLFVDGIHRENNIPWNSNIITERVSNCVVKTISGRVYVLVGKMNFDVHSVFPKWLLKKFVNGFPPNWKALYEKFLSESREETEGSSKGRSIIAKTKSGASSINGSVKRCRQKPMKTPASCPPASSSCTKVSRSGRVIKAPLEYWKGGRVILDAHMNVTIHECYDTSICQPEVATRVSAGASQKPARVFLPCSESHKQCESASDEEAPVPLRRVKAPIRTRNRAKVNHEKKPSCSPEPPVETFSSPDEWSGRRTRSSQRCPATERTQHVDIVPQKQREPEKSSTRRSKKQTHDTTRPSVRASGSKRAVAASTESSTVNDKTSPHQSSDDEFCVRRKKSGKEVHRKTGVKVLNKSQASDMFLSSSKSSEESGEELKKRTRARVTRNSDAIQTQTKHKRSKCTKTSPPTNPLPKSTQSSKKHKASTGNTQHQDEEEWTEAELMKLQEAVCYYPKHRAGYWAKVARRVGTRSAEECHKQHTSWGTSQTPAKRAKNPKKEKMEAPKDPDHPVISARVGTLKRKQQVRQFLEAMPREDVDDVFSTAYMQNKRFEMPSMCPSDDHDSTLSDLEPLTPMSTGFPEVKTPQCLHITPGMMGSPNSNNNDKYVYQLQKRMKKSQFNVYKQAPPVKSFTPTPSVKRTMRRCGNTENDTFVVWEMFPGNNGALSESDEEEDFYFSENE